MSQGISDLCFFSVVQVSALVPGFYYPAPALTSREVPEGTKGRSPQNVKTAAPETQKMMGAENIRYRRKHERIFF
ncbi:hypothetical protein ACEW2M_004292 [Escherichia coli]